MSCCRRFLELLTWWMCLICVPDCALVFDPRFWRNRRNEVVLAGIRSLTSMRRETDLSIVPFPCCYCWITYSLTTNWHGFIDRKEIKELQCKEIALKKAAAKGSKADQKAKKKSAEEEVRKNELVYLKCKQSRFHSAGCLQLGSPRFLLLNWIKFCRLISRISVTDNANTSLSPTYGN